MEYAKKMMLVEPRLMRPSMREKSLSKLDEMIEETLTSDLPDDEKAKRYTMTLNKFRYYDEPPVTPVAKKDDDILQSIQSNQQYKAKRLLQQLKKNSDIKFDDDGQIIYRQSLVPNSNISDLLTDVLKKKTTVAPVGWQQFSDSLKASNIGRELVVNEDRWKYMNPVKKEDSKPKKRVTKKIKWDEY